MQVFVIIVAVILFLLVVPLFVQVRVYTNIYSNIAVFAVSLFGIKIVCKQAEIQKGQINIIGAKRDRQIAPNSASITLFNKFVYYLILKIKIVKLAIFCDVAKHNDAFTPSIICAWVNAVLSMLVGILYTKKGVFDTTLGGETKHDKEKVVFCSYCHFAFNLLMILIAYIQAKQKTKKGANICSQ